MREIKFRAWDKKKKEMFYNFLLSSTGIFSKEGHRSRDCIIMQFTGLQDKNGKDIYEGDIVKVQSTQLSDTQKVIKWEDTGFNIQKEDFQYIEESMGGQLRGYENIYTYEVIGNIYQDKELLK